MSHVFVRTHKSLFHSSKQVYERSYPRKKKKKKKGVSLLLQAVMNKIDRTPFSLKYLDDNERLARPSLHLRHTTSNKFSSILEVAPYPVFDANNSMCHPSELIQVSWKGGWEGSSFQL